jgi:hypothetical protein
LDWSAKRKRPQNKKEAGESRLFLSLKITSSLPARIYPFAAIAPWNIPTTLKTDNKKIPSFEGLISPAQQETPYGDDDMAAPARTSK